MTKISPLIYFFESVKEDAVTNVGPLVGTPKPNISFRGHVR